MDIVKAYQSYHLFASILLPTSANVDILLFLIGLKPCIRTTIKSVHEDIAPFKLWCDRHRINWYLNSDGHFYLSKESKLLEKVVRLDHLNQKHEFTIGKLFGYPDCCSANIAKLGEANIDRHEERFVELAFQEEFELINTKYYSNGKAFISHVPCSNSCQASLEIAKKLLRFLENHSQHPLFSDWLQNAKLLPKELVWQ